MDAKISTAVTSAINELFKNFLESDIRPYNKHTDSTIADNFDVSIVIGFGGELSGTFILQCPKRMCVEIANKMLGAEIEENSDEMKDAAAEFMNMIVGRAKTFYNKDEELFKISVPATIIGKNYVIYTKSTDEQKMSLLKFIHNGYSFNLKICLR